MAALNNVSAMQDIYERLEPLGFKRKFLRECILPGWWQDELAEIPANRAYAEIVLSRQLGLDLSTLRDRNAPLKAQAAIAARFKRRRPTADDQLSVPQTLGWRLATAAALSLEKPLRIEDWSAATIREHILSRGAPWVGLTELLRFCWEIGVPVVHLRRVPDGKKAIDGMATWTEDRPAIVLASGRTHPAWHLFFLAHEFGHIICGHVAKGSVSVDTKISAASRKRDERAANAFALELLSGDPNFTFRSSQRRPSTAQLATEARTHGTKMRIDPGFIALSYSWKRDIFAVGVGALNVLSPDASAAEEFRKYYNMLDLEELPEDSRHVFECLTEAA